MRGTQWSLNPSGMPCDYPAIGNISNLQFRIEADEILNPIRLEDLLPLGCTLPNVANLAVHCFNMSAPRCDETAITYNGSHLPITFPNLQGIYFQGVYPSSTYLRSETFPWTNKTIKLPFNITRTLYEQEQYTNGISASTPRDEFRRLLSLNRLHHVEILDFCNLNGTIARIDLHFSNVDCIPETCFNQVDGLVLLDLSYNNLQSLDTETFSHLSDLRQLYLNNNELHHVQLGLFDHLHNLRHLDLSNNRLSAIWQYLFQNLTSLESCTFENNSLSKIEYGSFPAFSMNLTFINARNNQLLFLPKDCLRFPMLRKCDCDNNNITLESREFEDLIRFFEPFDTYLWDPLAYYGEAFSYYSEGLAHETDQTEISLQNNNITDIPFTVVNSL